jgi:hypothetical protein
VAAFGVTRHTKSGHDFLYRASLCLSIFSSAYAPAPVGPPELTQSPPRCSPYSPTALALKVDSLSFDISFHERGGCATFVERYDPTILISSVSESF